jgi:hypothetical protein
MTFHGVAYASAVVVGAIAVGAKSGVSKWPLKGRYSPAGPVGRKTVGVVLDGKVIMVPNRKPMLQFVMRTRDGATAYAELLAWGTDNTSEEELLEVGGGVAMFRYVLLVCG